MLRDSWLREAAAEAPPAGGLPLVVKPSEDPGLKAMKEELARLSGKIDGIRVPAAPRQQPQPGQPLSKKELEAKFYEDPLMNSATIAHQVVQNALAQQGGASFDTLVEVAKSQARTGNEDIWEDYSAEIEAMVMTATETAPLSRQNIHVWKNACNQIKGIHIDEILTKRGQQRNGQEGKASALHISGDGGPAGVSRQAPAAAELKLTPDEQRVARGLGISNEEYQKGKVDYESQSSKPNVKSSWDSRVTFSTREQRKQQALARAKK